MSSAGLRVLPFTPSPKTDHRAISPEERGALRLFRQIHDKAQALVELKRILKRETPDTININFEVRCRSGEWGWSTKRGHGHRELRGPFGSPEAVYQAVVTAVGDLIPGTLAPAVEPRDGWLHCVIVSVDPSCKYRIGVGVPDWMRNAWASMDTASPTGS